MIKWRNDPGPLFNSLTHEQHLSGHTHAWSDLIAEHLYFITLADNIHRMPVVPTLFRAFFPSTLAVENRNSQYARAQIARYAEFEKTVG